jgi:hypothetical protein
MEDNIKPDVKNKGPGVDSSRSGYGLVERGFCEHGNEP